MQALRERLEQLGNSPGCDLWQVLKESENDLREELVNIKEKQQQAIEQGKLKLVLLKQKKNELKQLREKTRSLQEEYNLHTSIVEQEITKNGLDFKKMTRLFELAIEDTIKQQKNEVVELLNSETTIKGKIEILNEKLGQVIDILKVNKTSNIHEELSFEIEKFYSKAIQFYRFELWTFLQQNNVPIKPIIGDSDNSNLYSKLAIFCKVSFNLDYLKQQNNLNSVHNFIASFFGHLVNLCLEMINNEKGPSNFDWILECAHKWSQNLKVVVLKTLEQAKIELKEASNCEKSFNLEFLKFIQQITKAYLDKNLDDPSIFFRLSSTLKKFESEHEIDFDGQDLNKPFYQPKVLSKWILLEIEMFSFETSKLFGNTRCFDALPACSLGDGNIRWASEATCYFEEWITRLDSLVLNIRHPEAQLSFYEAVRLLIRDFCFRIHETAIQLYMEPTWANDVYLVMNTVWEIRSIIESITFTWPVSSVVDENDFEREWNRLGSMITEYLNERVSSMDVAIRVSYMSESEKIRKINTNFYRIIKCLTNVAEKASQASRSVLLNKLVAELFKNLQLKFDTWQKSSLGVLSVLYNEIYSNLLPHLEFLSKNGVWERQHLSRKEIVQLDALMKKSASNNDPSGELVKSAFKSIDEEQVIILLKEIGIKTSDHTFQDYQILAENWNRIKLERQEQINSCFSMILILVMGLPGSGKTTFRRRIQESFSGSCYSTSFDEFLLEKRQELSARGMRKMFENHMKLEISSFSDEVCLIEDTFHLKSMRRPFSKIAKQLEISIGIVFMNLDVEEAITRNSGRIGREKQPNETIRKIHDKMESPDEFNRVFEISKQEDCANSIEILLKKLSINKYNESSLKINHKPIKVQEVKLVEKNSPPSEMFDVMTRRIVGDLIKSSNYSLAPKKLNEARKVVLSRMKSKIDVKIVKNEENVCAKMKEEIILEYHRSTS